jgi:hypothetical protein
MDVLIVFNCTFVADTGTNAIISHNICIQEILGEELIIHALDTMLIFRDKTLGATGKHSDNKK